MPRLSAKIPRTLDDCISAIVDLQREVAAWVDGDDVREERARRELKTALTASEQLFASASKALEDKVMAEVAPLRAEFNGIRADLAEALEHLKAASVERHSRKAREDAEAVAEAVREKKGRERRALLKVLIPVLAILATAATGAVASHVTEGPHGIGTAEHHE